MESLLLHQEGVHANVLGLIDDPVAIFVISEFDLARAHLAHHHESQRLFIHLKRHRVRYGSFEQRGAIDSFSDLVPCFHAERVLVLLVPTRDKALFDNVRDDPVHVAVCSHSVIGRVPVFSMLLKLFPNFSSQVFDFNGDLQPAICGSSAVFLILEGTS